MNFLWFQLNVLIALINIQLLISDLIHEDNNFDTYLIYKHQWKKKILGLIRIDLIQAKKK